MVIDNISSLSAVAGGFFGDILLGYAIKKVVKLIAVADIISSLCSQQVISALNYCRTLG